MSFQSQLLNSIKNISHAFDKPPEFHTRPLYCTQVHGKEIALVDTFQTLEALHNTKADGLIATTNCTLIDKVKVGIQTADCLPILITSKNGQALGAFHGGWRGLHLGILPEAIARFSALGIPAHELLVAIGPAIEKCCFEVSSEVISAFDQAWGHLWRSSNEKPFYSSQPPSNQNSLQAKSTGSNFWIDLKLIARLQLIASGVPASQIESLAACTYCDPENFASFRRSTHQGQKAPRQWSWIGFR